jgi:hypothetical protein
MELGAWLVGDPVRAEAELCVVDLEGRRSVKHEDGMSETKTDSYDKVSPRMVKSRMPHIRLRPMSMRWSHGCTIARVGRCW